MLGTRFTRYHCAVIASPAWRRDVAGLLVLGAFCAALLRRTLLEGGAMVGYDLFTYFFPAKSYSAAALGRGELPLWNPDLFFGAPFLANVQMAVLYPFDALFGVLEFPRAVAISQWLHLAIGAAGMYALCRWGWGLDASGGLIGGLAFAGGGFFGAHMGHLNQVHAGVWLPWVALCYLRLAAGIGKWRGGKTRAAAPLVARRPLPVPWLVLGGLVVALQLTAGHLQEGYYSLAALGLLALAFTCFPPARAPRRWAHLPAYGAIVANGGLLAAGQLLPALELAGLSYRRGGVPLEEAVTYAVERTHILETLLPTYWSLPSQEVTGYVGVVALPLIGAALGASPARRQVLGLAALALAAVTLALGAYTPLYPALHRWTPFFSAFRAPGRWLLISTFALAGLAGHGATALRRAPSAPARERAALGYGAALTGAAAVLLFVLWRTNEVHAIQWLPPTRVAVLWALAALGATAAGLVSLFSPYGWPRLVLAAALALELGLAARNMEYNRPGSSELYRAQPALAAHLGALEAGREAAGPGGPSPRVVSLAVETHLDAQRLRAADPEGDGEHRQYAAMREALKPNLGVIYGLPTIDGYDGGLLPTLEYARFKSLLVAAEPAVPHFTLGAQVAGRADAGLLAALNVRFLISDGRYGPPGPGWTLRPDAPGAAWLYENEQVFPRAYLVGEVVVEPGAVAALGRLAEIDWGRTAVVDAPVELPAAAGDAARAAQVVRYSPHDLEIQTRSSGPGLLVVTDAFYPGWRATVDGRPAPIMRTNLLFRGVALPAGPHRVRLWFEPVSVKAGLGVSALAVVLNALACGTHVARRRIWRRV